MDLTFVNLLSNILQQYAINLSKTEVTKSSAFYVKGKFMKFVGYRSKTQKEPSRSNHDKKTYNHKPSHQNTAPSNRESLSRPIICYNCSIPGQNSPDCKKPKRNQGGPIKCHLHNYKP